MSDRIATRFAKLRAEGRGGLVTFTMMGDPDIETSFEILKGLPAAGADVIEIGSPFTDPMADGPVIQVAGLRALRAGITLHKTLDLVRRFRESDQDTPLILMGYYNPIYIYGVPQFLEDAKSAGLDGMIVVDLPSEEDQELCIPAMSAGLNFIRLVAPTTDEQRLPVALNNSSGFVYYISITGITGAGSASSGNIADAVERVRRHTDLPVCVGFGIKTPEQAAEVARVADGAVVGSALIDSIAGSLDAAGQATADTVAAAHGLVAALADGVRRARVSGANA